VDDLYFDDRTWAVRYLAVDAGNWLPGRQVLVSPVSVRSSDPTTLHVALSKHQVATSPGGAEPAVLARVGNGGDLHLQTATAVLGHAIRAEDGEIGHVKDVLVDDKAWAVRYLVVDTRHWWSGKKVLISPEWLTRVTWDESKTLFCIVTAVDDSIASPRTAMPSIEHGHTAAPRFFSSNAPGKLRPEQALRADQGPLGNVQARP
jgi:hypothetical protein